MGERREDELCYCAVCSLGTPGKKNELPSNQTKGSAQGKSREEPAGRRERGPGLRAQPTRPIRGVEVGLGKAMSIARRPSKRLNLKGLIQRLEDLNNELDDQKGEWCGRAEARASRQAGMGRRWHLSLMPAGGRGGDSAGVPPWYWASAAFAPHLRFSAFDSVSLKRRRRH